MDKLFQQAIALLNAAGYRFDVAEQQRMIRVRIEADTGRFVSYLRILDLGQLVMYSKAEKNVPAKQRKKMAEFLTRANFGIVVGNFELDFDDGEVRYKTSIDSNGEPVTPNVLASMVNANLANMELYLPGIEAVTSGEASPEEALKLCQPQDEGQAAAPHDEPPDQV